MSDPTATAPYDAVHDRRPSIVQRVASERLPTAKPVYLRDESWQWLIGHVVQGCTYTEIAASAQTTTTTIRKHVVRAVEAMLNRGDLIVPGFTPTPGRRIRIDDVDTDAMQRRLFYRHQLREAEIVGGEFVVDAVTSEIVLTNSEDATTLRITVEGGVSGEVYVGKLVEVSIRGRTMFDHPSREEWATPDGDEDDEEL